MRKRIAGCLLLVACLMSLPLAAQSTTATLRGKVADDGGRPIPDAEINAVSTTTGFVHTVRSSRDGSYLLAGLTPGTYNVIVAAPGRDPVQRDLDVRIGQLIDVNFTLTGTLTLSEAITVVGNQIVEMKATEAGTNVTPQQIEALPQPERNFLNFAQLAPGVSLSKNPERKTFSANGLDPEQTNVFIDGVSFKNDVLLGGFTGGDASRGNPFPQNAVQEFKVLTNNFSAEYDRASSAVITAITKSGTNEFSGNLFLFYLPKDWISNLEKGFQFNSLTRNPDYRRYQAGLSVGGSIIRDRLHYFASYEGTDEHAITTVAPGTPPAGSNFPSNINPASYAGTFTSPFRGNLAFGKLSWAPMANHLADLSASYRRERDIRGFGGQTTYEAAENIRNWVYDVTAHHQWTGSTWFNNAMLSWQTYGWNPSAVKTDAVRQNFFGVIGIGGKDTTQRFEQRRIELRDKFTTSFTAAGTHTFEVGGNIDWMNYDVTKCFACNPIFNYRVNPNDREDYSFPFEAFIGFGDPHMEASNTEFGVFVQDSWVVNPRLNLNLGLRWDYESNMIDKDYVTPAPIRQALSGVLPSGYLSTGNEREAYTGAWQPRLGFAYDIFANSRTVVFGGYGRFYDRLFLNATLDERFRLQFPVYRLGFSNPNFPAVSGKILWNPSYLSVAGLQGLVAQGSTRPEIFLMHNDTKPPYSNQWNLGVRQALPYDFTGSVSYNVTRGFRGFTWLSASGICCQALVPGFGNVIISDPQGKRFWYDALFVTLERPYTSQSRWGARLAWTHAKAEQNGNDLFSLDYPSASQYPTHIVPGTERDRIVLSGIFGLPFDVRFSTLISLGSGAATTVLDFSQGFSLADRMRTRPFSRSVYPPKENGFADKTFDFSLEKNFPIGPVSVGVRADLFNAFNSATFGCLNNFLGPGGNPADIGKPNCVTNLGRRYQLGLKLDF